MREYAIVLLYSHYNRYSVNALCSAIDGNDLYDVYLVNDLVDIINLIPYFVDKYKRVIVGISFSTYNLVDDIFLKNIKLVNNLEKRYWGRILSVAGGPHPSGDPIGSLYSLGFSVVVIGEGEETFPELANSYFIKGFDELDSVKGIMYRVSGEPVFTGRRRFVELDNYPPFPYWRNIFGPIEITRGCPNGCYYCQVSYLHGFYQRNRSVDSIVMYAGIMAAKGYRDIRFITPNGLGYGMKTYSRKPRLDKLLELLDSLYRGVVVKYGARIFYGTFPSEVRPEHLTEEAARILRKYVVNKNIIIGAQSGSERILKIIHRGHSVEDVLNAVDNAIKTGFIPDVDFIIGFPFEEDDDYKDTLNTMKILVEKGARIHLHYFMPLPGSPYSFLEPKDIPQRVRREIYRLLGKGKVYGQWMQQEKISKKIVYLRKKGIIMPQDIARSSHPQTRDTPSSQ